jgi:hypothetical protein
VTALVVAQTVVVAVLGLLVVSLLRSHAAILRRLHDAGIGLDHDDPHHGTGKAGPVPVPLTRPGVVTPGPGGDRAVDIVGTTPRGSALSVAVSSGRPTLLAFLSSGCTTCAGFWEAFSAGVALPGDLRLVIVARGDDAEDGAALAALAPRGVLTVRSSEAWDHYRVPGSPYFVLVEGGQVRGEGSALDWGQVHGLLERALGPAGLPAGRSRRHLRHAARLQDTDAELLAAGIRPGDPSLYPPPGPGGRP